MINLNAVEIRQKDGRYKGLTETRLFTLDGNLKAVFPPNLTQPRYNSKKIAINCFTYGIASWSRSAM